MPKTKAIIPQTAAKSLRTAELELETMKEAYKAMSAPLEAKIEEMRSRLLEGMQRTGIKSIKLEGGDVYMRVPKTTFQVTDEDKAFTWGQKNNCLRLDKIAANKILLKTIGVPDGFEQHDEEHLTIKRATENG